MNPDASERNPLKNEELTENTPSLDAVHVAVKAAAAVPSDPDLAAVVEAWAGLPAAVKAGIVAMVKASV